MQNLSPSRPVWKWAKRAVFALAGMIAGAVLCLAALLGYDRYSIAQLDRTVDGPLLLSSDDPVTLALFAELSPVFARESLRVVAIRFHGQDFALALWLDQEAGVEQGLGQIVIADRHGQATMRNLRIPTATLKVLFSEWDEQIAEYRGSRYMGFDGNQLAFDRRSGRRTQSGYGNNPCHYDRLGDLFARHLGPFVPELNEWRITPKVWSDRRHLCHPSIWGRIWHQLVIPTRP